MTHTFSPNTCMPEAGESPTSSRSAYTTISAIEFQARYNLWTKHRHQGSFCRDQMRNSAFLVQSVWGARVRHSRTKMAPGAKVELWASRLEGWIHFFRDPSVVCYSATCYSTAHHTELRRHCTSKAHTHSLPSLFVFFCGTLFQYVRFLGKSSRKENFQKNILPHSNNQLIRKK